MRWRPLVLVLALVVLAGGWRVWDAFTTPQVAFITPTPQVDVDCGDFANQVEAQFRLRRALDPQDAVQQLPEGRAREYLARHRRDKPRVIKALDPDGDGKACNKEPGWLPPRKAPE